MGRSLEFIHIMVTSYHCSPYSLEDYRLQEYEAIVKGNKMLVDGAIPLEVFKYNVEKIYEDLQQEKKKETYRFWRLVIFYLFGPGGSGKTGLVQELFSDELSDKPKKQQSGSNWWNGYEDQEIVLIDEFYTKIDWENMIIEKSNKLNLRIDGEHIIENNYVYWRKSFPEYKK
ncbi:hypothetical protein C2G38_2042943 [Gigaspora rosea]|uniref:Helicase superfamily 3 single-stranded DNA/RNA virus domain-containing protein n=1 Tax=Gigaspora rosea TaxID=44941 RepID=A0A397UPB8_9GLOM|nr:hypothetical protein C2G38_2042943 [Gigaspora rosea]